MASQNPRGFYENRRGAGLSTRVGVHAVEAKEKVIMKIYYKTESPEQWQHFWQENHRDQQGNHLYPESVAFIRSLGNDWGRYIPMAEEKLIEWEREIELFHNNSYGENCKRDIAVIRKCNTKNSEAIVSFV